MKSLGCMVDGCMVVQSTGLRHQTLGFILHIVYCDCSSRLLKHLAVNRVCHFEMEYWTRLRVYSYAVGSVRLYCVSMLTFAIWHKT